MGQYWMPVNYDAEETMGSWGKLGEFFFSNDPVLVKVLVRPTPSDLPQDFLKVTPLFKGTEGPTGGSGLYKLSVEILEAIIDRIDTYADTVCLAMTNTYFWDLAQKRLRETLIETCSGIWAGDRFIIIGDYADDLPSSLSTTGEQKKACYEIWNEMNDSWSQLQKFPDPFQGDHKLDNHKSLLEHIRATEEYKFIQKLPHHSVWLSPSRLNVISRMQKTPSTATWVLRNLSKQLYVTSYGIARSPEDVKNGPFISGPFGFGHCLYLNCCWSDDPSVSMQNRGGLERGDWAGDRFDIVREEVLREEMKLNPKVRWTNVSSNIREELAWYAETDGIDYE